MKAQNGNYCEAWIQTCAIRADGTRDSFQTHHVKARYAPMPHHLACLTWTASGYGRRIPLRYMVQWQGRWRRVYSCQISNASTAYIGNLSDMIIVQEIES